MINGNDLCMRGSLYNIDLFLPATAGRCIGYDEIVLN